MLILVAIILTVTCGCKGGGDIETPSSPSDSPVQPTPTTESDARNTPPDVSPEPSEPPTPLELEPEETEPEPVYISGEVVISFDFVKQSGSASNQYAVWIESAKGQYIKTLYATQWTARGGYKTRPDALSFWVSRVNRASMSETEVDAVSGATPKTGPQTYTWDLTDNNGELVPAGEYMFLVEGTLRWKNFVIYTGIITISDTPETVTADRGVIYEKSDNYKELTEESTENSMIGTVTVTFTPFEDD